MAATAPYTAALHQYSRTGSIPEREKRLNAAWNTTASGRLPSVLRDSHVNRTEYETISSTKAVNGRP